MSATGIGNTTRLPPPRPGAADHSPARAASAAAPTGQPAPAPSAPVTSAQVMSAQVTSAQSGVQVDIAGFLPGAAPPVDHDRVAQIRDALRDGTYPIVPAKIADAVIAARLSLGGHV